MNTVRRRILAFAAAGLMATPVLQATAADKVSVAIGQKGLWDTMVTVHGIEEGFFKKEGLDVEVTWTRGGAETLQAVITGSVDFAMANGLLGVLSAYEKGAPVRIVGAEMTGAPDLFWYAKAGSGINSLKDGTGKTMGFSRPGSSTNLVALELVKVVGTKPELTPTGGISATRTQVLSGQIDIGWSVPPFNLDLVSKGDIKIIARGSDLPELSGQTIRVNVANADFLAKSPDVVARFMKGYTRTIDWMYDNQKAAIARYAKFNKVDEAVAAEAIKFYPRKALAVSPIAGIHLSMAQAVTHKKLKKPLTSAQIDELVQLDAR